MTGFRQNRVRRDQERRAVAATQRRLVGVGRHRPSMVAARLTVAAARTAGGRAAIMAEVLAGGPTALLVGLPTEWHGRRSPSLRSPLGDGGTERRLIHTVPRTGSPADRTKRPAMRFRGRQARRCPFPNIQADWPTASVHLSLPYKWHRMWRKDRRG